MASEILSSDVREIDDCFTISQAPASSVVPASSVYVANASPAIKAEEEVKKKTGIENAEKQKVDIDSVPDSVMIRSVDVPPKFPLLEKLLSFFGDPGHELNPVLAGYVAKVFGSLMEKKRAEILKYLQVNNAHIDNFVRNAGNVSVSEAMGKLLNNYFGDTQEGGFVAQRREIIRRLITAGGDRASLEGRWETLIALVNSKVELQYLLSPDIIDSIYKTTCESRETVATGLRLVLALMRSDPVLPPPIKLHFPFKSSPDSDPSPPKDEPVVSETLDYKGMLESSVRWMPFLVKYVSEAETKVRFSIS